MTGTRLGGGDANLAPALVQDGTRRRKAQRFGRGQRDRAPARHDALGQETAHSSLRHPAQPTLAIPHFLTAASSKIARDLKVPRGRDSAPPETVRTGMI